MTIIFQSTVSCLYIFFLPCISCYISKKTCSPFEISLCHFFGGSQFHSFYYQKKKINCLIVALQYLLVTCIPHVLHSVISGGYPELFHFLAILNWNPRNRNLSCADFISFEWFPKNEWSGCHLLPYAMHLFSGFWRISYFLP